MAKEETIVDKGKSLTNMKKHAGWKYLVERIEASVENFNLDDAVDWEDYKFRLGVLKGLSLVEEIASITIKRADRARRGKKVY